ncbi:MAG: type II CAAX endopeptidase family protein [Hyphomicrobiaceae bacterium]
MSVETVAISSGRYPAETPWGPWQATFATLAVTLSSIALSVVIGVGLKVLTGADISQHDQAVAWAPMLGFQVLMVLGAIWLAGRMRGEARRLLALGELAPALPTALLTFVVLGAASFAYTMAIFVWQPEIVRADMATFAPMIRSSVWPIYALIIIVGAPLSEELLFRGFLQSALAKSRIGYLGASIVTTLAWGALHIQYSIYGLAEIFVVGFVLCWVLRRTGTLWATILMHGLYNGIQFVGMMYRLFPWT